MPHEKHLTQLHELLAYLGTRRHQHSGRGAAWHVGQMGTTVDLTYLSDTAVLLRYYSRPSAVRQAFRFQKGADATSERFAN